MTTKQKEILNTLTVALGISTFWIFFIVFMFSIASRAATYEFKYKENVIVEVNAVDKYKGFKMAAMICYRTLTKNVYPGEDRGLEIIDICANPSNYETADAKKKK